MDYLLMYNHPAVIPDCYRWEEEAYELNKKENNDRY